MTSDTRTSRPRSRGFTLVELLIVVVILAILAAVVIPQFSNSADEARRGRFADNLRTFVSAAQIAAEKSGDSIEDGSSGVLPAELADYVKPASWENGTPMGGVWDSERDSFGVASAIGVHYLSGGDPGDEEFVEVDSLLDDGSLSSGAFQKLGDGRYYFILKD
jgi:prepilin-type N-terminal cleavage/methylation domain-containing protein